MSDQINLVMYRYIFHAEGNGFLVTSVFLKNYVDLQPLVLRVGKEWAVYLPKEVIERTLNEGVALASDSEKLRQYREEFENYLAQVPDFVKQWQTEKVTPDSWLPFVDFASRLWRWYRKTEWFYTDKLYASEDYAEGRKQLEELKQKGREAMNSMFFGDTPFLWAREQISKQLRVSLDEIDMSSVEEITTALKGEGLSGKRFERQDGFGVVVIDSDIQELSAHEARQLNDQLKTENVASSKEIKGTVAMKGKVRGKVTVIPSLYGDMKKMSTLIDVMPKGNILVATTTSPELMVAVRKAAAIVTDQGGLGSHAAIVSRELGIPCIVGTRVATQVLEEGDDVEVDADKGIVRILERK